MVKSSPVMNTLESKISMVSDRGTEQVNFAF